MPPTASPTGPERVGRLHPRALRLGAESLAGFGAASRARRRRRGWIGNAAAVLIVMATTACFVLSHRPRADGGWRQPPRPGRHRAGSRAADRAGARRHRGRRAARRARQGAARCAAAADRGRCCASSAGVGSEIRRAERAEVLHVGLPSALLGCYAALVRPRCGRARRHRHRGLRRTRRRARRRGHPARHHPEGRASRHEHSSSSSTTSPSPTPASTTRRSCSSPAATSRCDPAGCTASPGAADRARPACCGSPPASCAPSEGRVLWDGLDLAGLDDDARDAAAARSRRLPRPVGIAARRHERARERAGAGRSQHGACANWASGPSTCSTSVGIADSGVGSAGRALRRRAPAGGPGPRPAALSASCSSSTSRRPSLDRASADEIIELLVAQRDADVAVLGRLARPAPDRRGGCAHPSGLTRDQPVAPADARVRPAASVRLNGCPPLSGHEQRMHIAPRRRNHAEGTRRERRRDEPQGAARLPHR